MYYNGKLPFCHFSKKKITFFQSFTKTLEDDLESGLIVQLIGLKFTQLIIL